jgi:hypothetical protein
MGRLSITPVTHPSTPVCQESADIQPSHSPSVYAEIKISVPGYFTTDTQIYRYEISGVPFSCLQDLPALVPYLEHILETQRYGPEQHTDTNYDIPRQLTFSAAGHPSQCQVIASSARALYNLLEGVAKNKKPSDIETLVINDKAQFYPSVTGAYLFFTSAIELLPKTFPKIKPIHFPALTTLQLYMADNTATVILGIANLLARQCLPQLKTLDLQFAAFCRAYIHKGGWLYTNDLERRSLYILCRDGLTNTPSSLPLEHLHLPFWCADGTELGLAALRRLYPGLKTLTIDMIIPTAIAKGRRLNWASSPFTTSTTLPNGYGYTTTTYTIQHTEHSMEFQIPESEEIADTPSLLTLLEEMQTVSQLECLEIYEWPPGKSIIADCSILQTAIANGWLPQLNSIAIRFNIAARYNYMLGTTIDPETEMDTSSLLEAVVNAKVPLKKLFLIMPEKNGYQGWLDAMIQGSFPDLEQFHYRLPDRWAEEKDPAYHARIETALNTLHAAVREGQLPKLRVFIVEGNHAIQMKLNIEAPPLPEHFMIMVQEIEDVVLAQKASE